MLQNLKYLLTSRRGLGLNIYFKTQKFFSGQQSNFSSIFQEANLALDNQNGEQAINLLNKLIEDKELYKNPSLETFKIHKMLSKAYMMKDDLNKALEAAKKSIENAEALKLQPKEYLELYDMAGNCLVQNENFEEAQSNLECKISLLNRSEGIDPMEIASNYYDLGGMLLLQGKLIEARVNYNQALLKLGFEGEELELRAKIYLQLSEVYREMGDKSYAITVLKKALGEFKPEIQSPTRLELLDQLSFHNHDMGNIEESIRYSEEVIKLIKEFPGEHDRLYLESHNRIGVDYHILAEYQKALNYFMKVMELNEKVNREHNDIVLNSYWNLSFIYQEKGDPKKAIDFANHALVIALDTFGAMSKESAECFVNLGFIYSSQSENKKAVEALKEAQLILEKNQMTELDLYRNIKDQLKKL